MRYANTHYHVDPIIAGKGFPLHSETPPIRTRKAAYAQLFANDYALFNAGYGVSTCRTTIEYCRERKARSLAFGNTRLERIA